MNSSLKELTPEVENVLLDLLIESIKFNKPYSFREIVMRCFEYNFDFENPKIKSSSGETILTFISKYTQFYDCETLKAIYQRCKNILQHENVEGKTSFKILINLEKNQVIKILLDILLSEPLIEAEKRTNEE